MKQKVSGFTKKELKAFIITAKKLATEYKDAAEKLSYNNPANAYPRTVYRDNAGDLQHAAKIANLKLGGKL
jgi:hypothetical protein